MTRPLRLEFEGARYHITSRAKPLNEYLRLEQDRNRAIARAYHSGGYTLREIGACFNLHYSTVSIIVKKSNSKSKSKT